MAQLFSNAARSTLSASIIAGDTTFTVNDGTLFPVANTGNVAISGAADWFKAVLQYDDVYEIIYVRTHTINSVTMTDVLRGQEGTAAAGFPLGAVVSIRVTAADYADFENAVSKAGDTMTGDLTLAGAPSATLHAATKGYVDSAVSGVDVTIDSADVTGALGFTPYNATNPSGYTANASDADLRDRTTHTGSQAASTITESATKVFVTPEEKTAITHTNRAALDLVSGTNTGDQTLSSLGIANVENKSSATIRGEITSGNVTTALGFTPVDAALLGANSGIATLDSSGLVPPAQLPSYVDDVIEAANFAALPVTGQTGKIYVALDSNVQYRWSGSAYVQLVASPGTTDALTEGSVNLYFTVARVRDAVLTGISTATNAVITAADSVLTALGKLQKQVTDNLATLTTHTSDAANPHAVTKTQVGLSAVENTALSTWTGVNTITTLGTVGTGTWQGMAIAGQFGGTGVANIGKTITLGGNLTTSGAFATTFTMTGATSVTFPTSGTLLTNSTLNVQSGGAGTMHIVNGSASGSDSTLTLSMGGGNRTIALAGSLTTAAAFTTAGAFGLTLTQTGTTNVTLPTSGVLATEHLQQNIQSAAYTCVLADAGKQILHPSADTTARTFTIPANASVAYPIGTALTFVNQNSAGVVTIAITTDTMRLTGAGTTGSRTLAANGMATALKITATEWMINGTGLS